jgi:hypothetical protein
MARRSLHGFIMREAAVCGRMKPRPIIKQEATMAGELKALDSWRSRDYENRVVVMFDRRPTDAEIEAIDDLLSRRPPAPAPAELAERAKALWQDILDKDDRTSPAEYPEMALLTFDEFVVALNIERNRALEDAAHYVAEHGHVGLATGLRAMKTEG